MTPATPPGVVTVKLFPHFRPLNSPVSQVFSLGFEPTPLPPIPSLSSHAATARGTFSEHSFPSAPALSIIVQLPNPAVVIIPIARVTRRGQLVSLLHLPTDLIHASHGQTNEFPSPLSINLQYHHFDLLVDGYHVLHLFNSFPLHLGNVNQSLGWTATVAVSGFLELFG